MTIRQAATRNPVDSPPDITLNGAQAFKLRRKMKVLFDYHTPFALAHGGLQYQIIQMKAALEQAGVETDYLRWWDAGQHADIIHFVGRPTTEYIAFAHGQNCKVIVGELLTATGSRSGGPL